jgi:hypothetical protein
MGHSAKFDSLNAKYKMGYITMETLAGWVSINNKRPGKGITAEEYEEITGEAYDGDA